MKEYLEYLSLLFYPIKNKTIVLTDLGDEGDSGRWLVGIGESNGSQNLALPKSSTP